MQISSGLLTDKEAAEAMSCSVAALRRWRREGRGPAFFRIGRLVRYSTADLENFVRAGRVETADCKEQEVSVDRP